MPTLSAGSDDRRILRSLVADVVSAGCANVAAKLREYRGGNVGDLIAEFRLGYRVAVQLSAVITFQTDDAADIRVTLEGDDYLVEVVHKSAPWPLLTVLYPDPTDLAAYAAGPSWKQSAVRLHRTIESLALELQPWVDAKLTKYVAGHAERCTQETACGEIADWLASELPSAMSVGKKVLAHPSGLARFDLKPLDEPPGRINGFGPLNADWVQPVSLRHSIAKKSTKAKARLGTAAGYVVGVVVDDAVASDGHQLLTSLLGPAICAWSGPGAHRNYRPVPLASRDLLNEARRRGRQDLLDLAMFDSDENELHKHDPGLYFNPICEYVSGVLALYYTEALQFVVNPFAATEIARLRAVFSATLMPF
jgi:hypothetical protein